MKNSIREWIILKDKDPQIITVEWTVYRLTVRVSLEGLFIVTDPGIYQVTVNFANKNNRDLGNFFKTLGQTDNIIGHFSRSTIGQIF